MKNYRKFIYLLFIPVFLACEPEALPTETETEIFSFIDFFSDTGEQKDIPPVKGGNN